MAFPKTTLRLLIDSLVAGFDGYEIVNVGILGADKNPDAIEIVSDDALPFLLFDIGNAQTSPWQAWQDFIAWDIPAKLKVKGPPAEVDEIMLDALQAIMQRNKELIGLPIDEDGTLVPYTSASAGLFDAGALDFIAERGGPFLRSFVTSPSQGSYATATLMFRIEATLDLDPRDPLPLALQIRLGIVPMSGSLTLDTTLQNEIVETVNPPPVVIPDSQILRSILVMPYSSTLTAISPTQSLTAIARYADWNSVHVESTAAWQTSDSSVATVDATGVVTRVAAGACTVSCSLNGVPSNGVAITCT